MIALLSFFKVAPGPSSPLGRLQSANSTISSGDCSRIVTGNAWNLEKVDAELAWEFSSTDNEILVGVCDSGIDTTNRYLSSKVDTTLSRDFIRSDRDPVLGASLEDFKGHGTHVAGTVAGLSRDGECIGIASKSNVKVVSLKVLDDNGNYRIDTLAKAIDYADQNGIKIVNFSGYCSDSDILRESIMNYSGIIVAAAGNIGGNGAESFLPAAYNFDNVISVGATDINDERAVFDSDEQNATDCQSSNYGVYVDIYAPGKNIYSAVSNQDPIPSAVKSGTSMAAPLVAGTVATMMSLNNSLTAVQIKNILLQTSDTIELTYGSGERHNALRLNAGRAVSMVAYNCESGKLTGLNFNPSTSVTIPELCFDSTNESLDVVETIGTGLFENNLDIEIVKMGPNINSIESFAFAGCTELSRIATIFNPTIGFNPFPINDALEIVVNQDALDELTFNDLWTPYLGFIRVPIYAGGHIYEASLFVEEYSNAGDISVTTLYVDDFNEVGFVATGIGIVGHYFQLLIS